MRQRAVSAVRHCGSGSCQINSVERAFHVSRLARALHPGRAGSAKSHIQREADMAIIRYPFRSLFRFRMAGLR